MDELLLTEKAILFEENGWGIRKERRTAQGGCVTSVYAKRPGSNCELFLGQYEELIPESVAARRGAALKNH